MPNREHDTFAADLWSDDPDVEITIDPGDSNSAHGVNSDAEKAHNAPNRLARLLAIVRRA